MPVTMPRVAPGQIITSASYNALAAEIEALHLRIDQLIGTLTKKPDPVVDPAAPPVKIRAILPPKPFDIRGVGEEIELTGENFAADAAHTRVLIADVLAGVKSATTKSIKVDIPLPDRTRPAHLPVRVDNLTTGSFDTTTIYVV